MIEIDGYDDLEIIGRGGFAVVYKARQVSVGREVAIKVLSDPSPDQDLVRRFERESKAVGALSWHPNIAAVVDAGRSNEGQAYIVFELLARGSLEDQLAAGPLPWPEAVARMIQVADATEAAHRADVLHRDIKPANILLTRLGDAKLADFGIASMQDGNKTETGMLATSIAHAAPELFDGTPSSVATDVYALGSTLFNLITGQSPFAVTPGERILTTIGRIAQEPPPQLNSELVPPPISNIIAHSLAKQPEYRMRSAAEFGRALQQVQRELGLPVTAMPVADAGDAPPAGQPPGAGLGAAGGPPTGQPHYVSPQSVQVSGRRPPKVRKPLSRTIGVLTVIAVLLAAVVAAALYYELQPDEPIAVTAGGVEVASAQAFAETLVPGTTANDAIDGLELTYWGIQPTVSRDIEGTTVRLTLNGEQTITEVGISNPEDNAIGRVMTVRWATSDANVRSDNPSLWFEQSIPDAPGGEPEPFLVTSDEFPVTTDEIVLLIYEVHDPDAPRVGIAEILLVAEEQ